MAKYGLNKVSLIGNLGADPETGQTQQGVMYARLRLALNERFRNREGTYTDRTEWVDVTIWRAQAEIAQKYLRKGNSVYIEGRLRNNSWTTPEGENRSRLEIEGSRMILLDPPPSAPGTQFTTPMQQKPPQSGQDLTSTALGTSNKEEEPDDLPF